MDETPEYGSIEDIKIIDAHGSTIAERVHYRDSEPTTPRRLTYAYRHLCDKTDLATIARIAHDLLSDESKLDPHIRFETRTSNSGQKRHYLVECYTKLVY